MSGDNRKDAAQADANCCGVHPGDIWRHYKGGLYVVREVSVNEDTLEVMVTYQSNARKSVWTRTLSNWVERVDMETEYTLPDGSTRMGRHRFTRVHE